jgi:hypothetical protein
MTQRAPPSSLGWMHHASTSTSRPTFAFMHRRLPGPDRDKKRKEKSSLWIGMIEREFEISRARTCANDDPCMHTADPFMVGQINYSMWLVVRASSAWLAAAWLVGYALGSCLCGWMQEKIYNLAMIAPAYPGSICSIQTSKHKIKSSQYMRRAWLISRSRR